MQRILIFILVSIVSFGLAVPSIADAQFVAKGESQNLGNVSQQQELQKILDAIARKDQTARKQVQAVLEAVASQKEGATSAQRKIDGIVGNLKVDLNRILSDYTKQSPPSGSLREVFRISQKTLDDIRVLTEDTIESARADKKADPTALTGKYLEYQKKLQAITKKALSRAEERLGERGTKAAIRKDLEKISSDIEREVEVSIATFTAENPEALESALRRTNKAELEKFAEAMAAQFKAVDKLSSDKQLDLSDDELEKFETTKQEMTDVVDRALSSIDSIVGQAAGSLDQLASQPASVGVNPVLQAKFKVQKQIRDIRDTAKTRLEKIASRAQADADADATALLKELFAKEAERQKNRLIDTEQEYEGNFLAGDPTKKQYQERKRKAQDEARGCTSFLCGIGNAAAGVGSALISGATRGTVNLPPSFIASTIGVRQPNANIRTPYSNSLYSGSPSLPYVGGRYIAPGAMGNQGISYDPQCMSQANTGTLLSFIGIAYASIDQNDGPIGGPEGATTGFGDLIKKDTKTAPVNTNNRTPEIAGPPASAATTPTAKPKSTSGFSRIFDFNNPLTQFAWGNATNSFLGGSGFGQGGCRSGFSLPRIQNCFNPSCPTYGGLGGYGGGYGGNLSNIYGSASPIGGLVYGQQGYNNSNLRFQMSQQYTGDLIKAFQLTQSIPSHALSESDYEKVIGVLRDGTLTYSDYAVIKSVIGVRGNSHPAEGIMGRLMEMTYDTPEGKNFFRQYLSPTSRVNGGPLDSLSGVVPPSTTTNAMALEVNKNTNYLLTKRRAIADPCSDTQLTHQVKVLQSFMRRMDSETGLDGEVLAGLANLRVQLGYFDNYFKSTAASCRNSYIPPGTVAAPTKGITVDLPGVPLAPTTPSVVKNGATTVATNGADLNCKSYPSGCAEIVYRKAFPDDATNWRLTLSMTNPQYSTHGPIIYQFDDVSRGYVSKNIVPGDYKVFYKNLNDPQAFMQIKNPLGGTSGTFHIANNDRWCFAVGLNHSIVGSGALASLGLPIAVAPGGGC